MMGYNKGLFKIKKRQKFQKSIFLFPTQRKPCNKSKWFFFSAPPTIMPFLFPNKLLNEGMRSAVSCQILEGSLPIQFDWTKDGLSLGSSGIDGVTIRGNDEYSSTLIIDHLRFLHRGNYTCKASNAAGFATHSAELTVNGKHTDLY